MWPKCCVRIVNWFKLKIRNNTLNNKQNHIWLLALLTQPDLLFIQRYFINHTIDANIFK